jgi:NTP pyrophosphatase (non-canonical NTP hydrolase)
MTVDRSKEILRAGSASALEKMSLPRNLQKGEITDLSFLELYTGLVMEHCELEDEIRKAETGIADTAVPIELLEAIRFEAGDVIAFASGIAAKADAEIAALTGSQPLLPGFDE